MNGDVYICPPTHIHDATTTCYFTHGCRCARCVPAAIRYRDRGAKVPACGTRAGYLRHKRRHEEVDEACMAANTRYQQEHRSPATRRADEAARRAAEIRDSLRVQVRVEDGQVVIVAPVDEAGMIAAAVLDRAIALESNRYAATLATPPAEQSARMEQLRALHKRIASVVRSVA